MTDRLPPDCRVDGAKHLSPSASDAEICEAFYAGLGQSLASYVESKELKVTLDITATGTIDASITDASGASVLPHATVSVDVMDRPMGLGDIEQLATTVATVMKAQ